MYIFSNVIFVVERNNCSCVRYVLCKVYELFLRVNREL